jgi:hypothetical protein
MLSGRVVENSLGRSMFGGRPRFGRAPLEVAAAFISDIIAYLTYV